jgi:hypothetical protein
MDVLQNVQHIVLASRQGHRLKSIDPSSEDGSYPGRIGLLRSTTPQEFEIAGPLRGVRV